MGRVGEACRMRGLGQVAAMRYMVKCDDQAQPFSVAAQRQSGLFDEPVGKTARRKTSQLRQRSAVDRAAVRYRFQQGRHCRVESCVRRVRRGNAQFGAQHMAQRCIGPDRALQQITKRCREDLVCFAAVMEQGTPLDRQRIEVDQQHSRGRQTVFDVGWDGNSTCANGTLREADLHLAALADHDLMGAMRVPRIVARSALENAISGAQPYVPKPFLGAADATVRATRTGYRAFFFQS